MNATSDIDIAMYGQINTCSLGPNYTIIKMIFIFVLYPAGTLQSYPVNFIHVA